MIEIDIKKKYLETSLNRISNINVKNNNPSKFGYENKRIYEGYIVEELVKDFLNINLISDTYNYDLLTNKGKKLEVKTISCKFKPKTNYLCTVNCHSSKEKNIQNADYYIFVRIRNDYKVGWLLGWIGCDEFYQKGDFIEKGKDFGNFKFTKANATVLEIKNLYKFE